MLERRVDDIFDSAKSILDIINITEFSDWKIKVMYTDSRSGGGTLPGLNLPSAALVLIHKKFSAKKIQYWLMQREIPIISRIESKMVWLDFRAVLKNDEEYLSKSILNLLKIEQLF